MVSAGASASVSAADGTVPGMALDTDVRDRLFASGAIPILAIERPGRAPVAVPIWHAVEPDGTAWIVTPRDSLKARLLREAGRCALVVDEVEPEVRYASAECDVVAERPATREDAARMARRNLPPEAAEAYIAWAEGGGIGPEVVFVLRPVAWLSAQMG
ncbi:hypothetical protein GCM10010968_15630 [Agrococcus terreus]|uniref:Pyridoxamine 5'-phosphate oxidase n=2 Tax=Agrococcus terreus TaxID=574649 RepID=A0ABQ2KJP2_9MICO|nr:hypothetical protein GCM10010968_15630 [Agrococcus terreus]